MSRFDEAMDGSPTNGELLQSERELTVFGFGIGSSADLEVSTWDVRMCATRLRSIARRTREAAHNIRILLTAVSGTAPLTSSGSGAVAEGMLVVADGDRRADQIDDLAARLVRAADGYESAEAANEARIWRLTRPAWNPLNPLSWVHIGTAVQAAWMDAWQHGQVVPTRHGIGMVLEESLWAVTGIDRPIPDASRALAGLISGVVSHRVSVAQVNPPGSTAPGPGDEVSEHEAIGDLEGVVEAIGGLYPDHGEVEPGTVRIDQVTAPDGEVSWLVLVPGTQGDLVGGQPFDWAGNPGAMVGEATGATAMVVQAMRMAGIQPGQQVVVAGHSQGGMVALNAANAVAGELDVSGVLTLGAPVGLLDAPEGTEVLSLEHVEDLVPGFDNAANPVGENWTTVERTLTSSIDADLSSSSTPRDTHDTPTYADTARLVDASDEGAVLDYLAVVAPVLNPEATATSSYYQGTRTD
ncbi:hypothetical protein [Pseudactinotalea sp.]|uniref:hypothetical protein n=1 Tax=Pseudactinotalea sp. TaxID=1926260 RepID=UPI003B3B4435